MNFLFVCFVCLVVFSFEEEPRNTRNTRKESSSPTDDALRKRFLERRSNASNGFERILQDLQWRGRVEKGVQTPLSIENPKSQIQNQKWWRRRESNPHPKVATSELYTFSPFARFSFSASKQTGEPCRKPARLTFRTRPQAVDVP